MHIITDALPILAPELVTRLVGDALAEDWQTRRDVTSQAVIPATAQAHAIIRARDIGVLAGLDLAETAFLAHDSGLTVTRHKADGDALAEGHDVMSIAGPAHALLSAERVALNYLGHLSGIASKTAKLVALIAHTEAKICDTRKTTPGLRAVEKYAVRAGGGANHRFGLYDAVLIKDNHIAVAGGITAALNAAQKNAGDLPIEIEVDTLAQFEEALAADAKIVLLDNMTPDMLRAAVALNQGRAILEASGRVSEDSVVGIAESGVDYISVGGITHSALTLDLGLDIDIS
ncbi:carboxylating nicotinate-nucleotide diphosphorylase [Alphaproteobacteria bacterium]|nr:carboxylating nicotinate-nucleotide diphosphorylase [Alphaproteobacteria bacterium]MDA8544733.1 carboxylating nicotinate-nucleotide diphosphorylase [Alphaproteobacteria bacterium]MDA8624391.1 carboxylating nicotinate-nucleotide diphosphorylase [Alphaproteobacteria bacterium]MDA8624491.1 carboxylating nicotinate-nucleotide diphosphorylase [Alphaproteobacteria bacterium]MDA8780600.1 carboxylating nicotinate-nucleotide diphosphorylase [Alphaproteobacteria bacterium]